MIKNIIYTLLSVLCISCSVDSTEAQVIYNINALEFNKLINTEEGIVLDVRTVGEISEGHIEDATNIDFYDSDFDAKLDLIRRDIPIYVYCRSGGRSSKTAHKMKELGFDKVYNLLGGFGEWKSKNFKVVKTEDKIFKKQKSFSILEFSDIIKSNDIVLLDFSTEWCVPCKKMKPIILEIKEENKNLKVIFIDADVNKELVKKYQIKGVPVFILFIDGVEKFRHVGVIDKSELLSNIKLYDF
tara:strand:+ start:1348 stop:2073 length:726 start_codon:yes stop_codon:yes gene_type:complete